MEESPRFLACNLGRYSKAKKNLQNIALTNKCPPFEEMLEGEAQNEYVQTEKISTHVSDMISGATAVLPIDAKFKEIENHDKKGKIGYFNIFENARIRKNFLKCIFA